ncbi:MAG: AI-2E family transporter [Peptococcaceae bacterium]|nr:AI-2E family transporter [Peptococcaceae bacterium]
MRFFDKRIALILLLALLILFFLVKVRTIIPPFIVGAIIAYLLSPAVNWLEKKGLNRTGAVLVIFIWVNVFFLVILFILLPKLYIELGKLVTVLPDRIQVIYEYLQSARNYYSEKGLPSEVNKLIDQQFIKGEIYLINWLESVINNIPKLVMSIGLMILSPVLAIYFLLEAKRISNGIINLVSGRMAGQWQKILQEIDYIIQRYIQGNLLDALIVGVLIGVGVKLIGVEYGLIIGVICGITNLIPYFGPVLGGIPAVALALSHSPWHALKVLLIIFVVQQVDGDIINPRLMSNKIGMHPLWVVFALLAGGELGGIVGMLIAVPVAAILRIFFREIYYYLVSPKNLKSTKN